MAIEERIVNCSCGQTSWLQPGQQLLNCADCGAALDVAAQSSVAVIAGSHHEIVSRAPRTMPPRYAEQQADAIFARVAGGTRTRRPKPPGVWRNWAVGILMLAIAGVLFCFDLDLAMLRMPSLFFGFSGLVALMKAFLGYSR